MDVQGGGLLRPVGRRVPLDPVGHASGKAHKPGLSIIVQPLDLRQHFHNGLTVVYLDLSSLHGVTPPINYIHIIARLLYFVKRFPKRKFTVFVDFLCVLMYSIEVKGVRKWK